MKEALSIHEGELATVDDFVRFYSDDNVLRSLGNAQWFNADNVAMIIENDRPIGVLPGRARAEPIYTDTILNNFLFARYHLRPEDRMYRGLLKYLREAFIGEYNRPKLLSQIPFVNDEFWDFVDMYGLAVDENYRVCRTRMGSKLENLVLPLIAPLDLRRRVVSACCRWYDDAGRSRRDLLIGVELARMGTEDYVKCIG